MADMAIVVGGYPADVQFNVSFLDWLKGFLFAGQSVIYPDIHYKPFCLNHHQLAFYFGIHIIA